MAYAPLLYRLFSWIGFSKYDRTRYLTHRFQSRDTMHGYPYISGDVFRAFCDHVVDATGTSFFPSRVKEHDRVFVKTKYLRQFVKYMHPRISHPYILVTHNGDEEIPGIYHTFLDDPKVLLWCGMNATAAHPKILPLPIGHANYGKDLSFENLIEDLQRTPERKTHLCYLNFSVETHPERASVKAYFSSQSFCTVGGPKSQKEYMKELAQARFTISPRGNGIDCCRVWEALLVGTIPVLKTTVLDSLYADLPVLIVNHWEEVTEKFLEEKYLEMSHKQYNLEKCYVEYWLKQIGAHTPRPLCLEKIISTSRISSMTREKNNLSTLFWRNARRDPIEEVCIGTGS